MAGLMACAAERVIMAYRGKANTDAALSNFVLTEWLSGAARNRPRPIQDRVSRVSPRAQRVERVQEFAGVHHGSPALEDFVDKAGVDLRILVRAAILKDDQAIVGVAGLQQRGKNHPAGGDAEEDKRVDLPRPQNHVEICSGEGADPV